MAITPIEFNGSISRASDISLMRNNEENKAFADQTVQSQAVEKNVRAESEEVVNKQNAEHHETRYDAKEKGNGTYQQNRQNKKKKKEEEDGRVIVKQSAGFDFRI